jgi:ferrochelatase
VGQERLKDGPDGLKKGKNIVDMNSNPFHVILLLNLGGPETLADVKPFLYRLFEDPEVIRIPFAPLRKLVAWAISTSREKKSQAMYATIGGGSPIRRLTDQQAAALETALSRLGHRVSVRTAFNCSAPLVEDVVKAAAAEGATAFLAFPLYPQYSMTTTKGALERAHAAVKRFAPGATYAEIRAWPTQPSFIDAHVDLINQQLASFPEAERSQTQLVFSAHSIPENLVSKLGDPYKQHMEQTVAAVLAKLGWTGPWTLSWQSKLGPVKWLEPSTEDTILKLGRDGVKNVLVVPIAFVTDHIETLYELDQELAEEAHDTGITNFRRTPGLNDHPAFIRALTELSLPHLK